MPITDAFRLSEPEDLIVPARRAVALTKSDTTEFKVTRGLWVGGAGNVAVKMADDTAAVTFVGVAAGTLLPLRVWQLMSTNTTATSVVALY
jgi:hypothetical protein